MDSGALENLIHRRASGMTIDREKQVDRDLLERIIRAAVAAPNHRKTRPLRVAVLQGESRLAFGATVAAVMEANGEEATKVEKARTKYGRAPVVLAVAAAPGESPLESDENMFSVAAGIQNMLLMIEAFGLTALWSTPMSGAEAAMNEFSGFEPGSRMLGLVYLGHGTRPAPPRDRPAPVVNWLD
ncbi:MAG: nitroreductase family protein [Ilumatobacteraceae bacterium]